MESRQAHGPGLRSLPISLPRKSLTPRSTPTDNPLSAYPVEALNKTARNNNTAPLYAAYCALHSLFSSSLLNRHKKRAQDFEPLQSFLFAGLKQIFKFDRGYVKIRR